MLGWVNKSIHRFEEEQQRLHDFLLEVDIGDRKLSLPTRGMLYVIRVIYHSCKGFWYDDGFSRAAALAYSMLAFMVPFFVLLLYVLLNENLPFAIHEYGVEAKNFFIGFIVPKHRVPEVSPVVDDLVRGLAGARDPLGVVGLTFLLVIAYSFLNMLEGGLNHIWKVTSPSIRFGRFPAFLLIICLGAAIIGLTKLANLPETVGGPINTALPWLTVGTIFYLILYLVPNTRVRPLPAVPITILATAIWLGMERAYDFYLEEFLDWSAPEIFGKLGLIPVILLWIYLSACVLLFAAEITYVIHHFQAVADRRFRIVINSRFFREFLSIRILLTLGRKIEKPLSFRQIHNRIPLPESEIKASLRRLAQAGFVQYRIFKGYLLKKSPDQIRLRTLLHLGSHALEQLKLVPDKSPQGRFCITMIEDIVESAAAIPADRTLHDALEELEKTPPEAELAKETPLPEETPDTPAPSRPEAPEDQVPPPTNEPVAE